MTGCSSSSAISRARDFAVGGFGLAALLVAVSGADLNRAAPTGEAATDDVARRTDDSDRGHFASALALRRMIRG